MAVLITGSKFNDGHFLPRSINGTYPDDTGNVQIEAGRIDEIQLNGENLPIENKTVNLIINPVTIKKWEEND